MLGSLIAARAEVRAELRVEVVGSSNTALKCGEMGSGKTTQVPQVCAVGGKEQVCAVGGKEQVCAVGGKEQVCAVGGKEQVCAVGGKEQVCAVGGKEEQVCAVGGKEQVCAVGGKEQVCAVGGEVHGGSPASLVCGETGLGKTTRVPQARAMRRVGEAGCGGTSLSLGPKPLPLPSFSMTLVSSLYEAQPRRVAVLATAKR
ncbi:unnamed protein product, partial [Closterium sp. Naga37s-1]